MSEHVTVQQPPPGGADIDQALYRRQRRRRKLLQHLPAIAAGSLLILIFLSAVLAPYLGLQDPVQQALEYRLKAPSALGGAQAHFLGTDQLGRDVFSRVVHAARVSLTIGVVSVLLSGAIGVSLGVWAGFRGGLADEVIMRLVDIQNAFPFIVLAIAIVAVLGPKLPVLIVTLAIWGWASYARVIRAEVLALREREFLHAASAAGARDLRIIFRHILPNLIPTLIVLSTFQMAQLVVAESSLSFLGLGVQPPTPSWGNMLADGRAHLDGAWWIATFPALAIMVTVLAINVLGDAIRDLTDPRMRR
jgi:peptide/nickel transport system permease protein